MCQLAATVTAPDAIIGSKLPLSEYEIPASMMPSGSTSAAAAAAGENDRGDRRPGDSSRESSRAVAGEGSVHVMLHPGVGERRNVEEI